MEEKLKYEIKISVYESGVSRMEPIKNAHPQHVKEALQRHVILLERAIIKSEIMEMLTPKPTIGRMPTAQQIMRSKQ